MNFDDIILQMTLEEKIDLLAGKDNWHLNLPSFLHHAPIMLTDGPHGIRKQELDPHTKEEITAKATCFPTASLVSCSWDKEVFAKLGEAIAKEAALLDVSVVLGPGLNIKKSGYNGRNFEYISEDPFLSGTLASAYIQAAEAKGIGTCVKHFALNNYETRRMSTNVVVDERALREIYLKGFEIAIRDGKPASVMSSYNRVNGEYASEHNKMLSNILRKEWKYPGVVMSDWGAVNDRVSALQATLDLEMPGPSKDNRNKLLEAVNKNILSIQEVNDSVKRILQFVSKTQKKEELDFDKHHELANNLAAESMVLLKNNNHILPLKEGTKIAVVGQLAAAAPIQGAGSSLVNATKITNFLDVLDRKKIEYTYQKGYDLTTETVQEALLKEAAIVAKDSELIVLFLGLDLPGDSEGQDRESLEIPNNQLVLLQTLLGANKPIVVVLSGGSSVIMPWENQVEAILYTGLYGQNGATAMFDLLYAKKNPSGKLSITFPISEEEDIFYHKDDIQKENVYYKDSIFVGYRYFSTLNKPVRYAFGHGLSYTNFVYSSCELSQTIFQEKDSIQVSVKVKNTGNYVGKEVVQLYIEAKKTDVIKPKYELKNFKKIELQPEEEQKITFDLSKEDFQHYCTNCEDWVLSGGAYAVCIGSSSADIRVKYDIEVVSFHLVHDKDKQYADVYNHLPNHMMQMSNQSFLELFDESPLFLPNNKYHENSTLYDIRHTIVGKIMLRMIRREVRKWSLAKNPVQRRMIEASALHTPLRALKNMSGGKFGDTHMEGVILWARKKYIQSLRKMLFSSK